MEETPGHAGAADTVALQALPDSRFHGAQTHRALQLSHHRLGLQLSEAAKVGVHVHLQFLLKPQVVVLLHSPADAGDVQVGGRALQVSVERNLTDLS